MPAMAPADSPSSSAIPVGGGDVGESGDVGGSGDGEGGGGGKGGIAMTTVETIVEVVTGADTLTTSTAAREATPDAASDALSAEALTASGGVASARVSVAVAATMTLPGLTSMPTVQAGGSQLRSCL